MAYGKKVVKGKVVDDKEEQVIIKKMKLLKAAGNSYWKIAEVLNSNKVLTKKEKGTWSAKTVHQIVNKKLSSKEFAIDLLSNLHGDGKIKSTVILLFLGSMVAIYEHYGLGKTI